MILVIIIMVAWLVILGPNLLKRRSRTVGGISSISHFHRQLQVLQHSGPQALVTPAYRLRAVDGSGASPDGSDGSQAGMAPKLTVVGADQLPRPALAFLGQRPSDPQPAPGALSAERTTTGTETTSEVPGSGPAGPTSHPPDDFARTLARRRRRDTLGVLTLFFVTTLLIGFIPGASVAWAMTLVSGLALTAYVALLVRMRQMAEERERKLHYLRPDVVRGFDDRAALAGAVGGDTPFGVTDLPVRVSGRYAHPSNQAVAAH
jgi:hypothetical protein